jgi:hypothetical protein
MKSFARTMAMPKRLAALSAAITMAAGAMPPSLDLSGQARLLIFP